jgi:hypothetical protein
MSDQIEELIREIAAKHGIAVARDDPILVLQTINNRLLQDSAKAQQAQLDTYKEELEGLMLRWTRDAREKAERILNVSLAASKETMEQMMKQGADATTSAFQAEMEVLVRRVCVPHREVRMIGIMNIFASAMTMLAVLLAMWTGFK